MRQVYFSPDAVRQFKRLEARERSLLKAAIEKRLRDDDATVENRNRFRLRRPSPHADFELRVQSLRLFYRVLGDRVEIVLIGRKRGNELIVDSERFIL